MTSLARQRGLSLIELMIALVLSATLLWGVLQIFDTNRNTMRMQTAFARVQESGRFATDLLTKEIRMADYWGCAPDEGSINNHLDPTDTDYLGSTAKNLYEKIGADGIFGIDNAGAGVTVGARTVLPGTDTLTLRGADDACAGTGRMVPSLTAASLHVSQNCQVEEGEIILLSNCQSGELMTVTNVQDGIGGDSGKRTIVHNGGVDDTGWVKNKNPPPGLQQQYGADARILKPYERTYFVSADGATGEPSLFVADTGADAMELVPGIQDMQILYGRDSDGDDVVDRWTPASTNAADMEEALAVKVQLVVASDTGVGAENLTVTDLDNADTTYTDGKLRKVYLSTAKVRNRGRM